ncbi:winged helix-turn-helix domain-containing protein [Tolumonas auensis]|uniref:winged helix-turn-helix domain-containing protein n=1 Tax=Tolumonas auensis TaxID=43948 RepID=UPI0002EFADA7|nr:winged helix-turn-helix domain-containing protein [Tolumonas auensis]
MQVKTPEQILLLLQRNPHMTLSEVADAIGKSVSTVERAVAKLKKQNRLVYHGPKKGSYWICQ